VVSGDSRLNGTQWRAACSRAAAALRFALRAELSAQQADQVDGLVTRLAAAVTRGRAAELRDATVVLELLDPGRSAARLGDTPPDAPDGPAALRVRERIVELIYVLEQDSPPGPSGLGPPPS
jgi:hypothetical protein